MVVGDTARARLWVAFVPEAVGVGAGTGAGAGPGLALFGAKKRLRPVCCMAHLCAVERELMIK